MADEDARIYRRADAGGPLRQGEILSDLRRFRIDPSSVAEDAPAVIAVLYPLVIVLTQDCDLTQQGRPEAGSDPHLPCILLTEVTTAESLRNQKDVNTAAWKLIRQNREERYHFLEAVPPDCDATGAGLGELALDFKRYLAVPTDEIYALLDSRLCHRRTVLECPYMEHLCHRFGTYLGRIALPRPHHSTPAEGSAG